MIRVDTRPRRKNSGKADAVKRDAQHLKWLRGRPCCVAADGGCGGKIEAAHVDHEGSKGMSTKAGDWAAVPLCRDHHAELHRGAQTFERVHRVDLVQAAAAFAAASPRRAELSELRAAWLDLQPRKVA